MGRPPIGKRAKAGGWHMKRQSSHDDDYNQNRPERTERKPQHYRMLRLPAHAGQPARTVLRKVLPPPALVWVNPGTPIVATRPPKFGQWAEEEKMTDPNKPDQDEGCNVYFLDPDAGYVLIYLESWHMKRRTICALPLLLVSTFEYSSAQQPGVFSEFNELIMSAFRLADQVTPVSAQLIRDNVLSKALQAVNSNVQLFLIAVLISAVEQRNLNNGLIVVSEESFSSALRKVCPLFPFC
jgi:hypothetical protein